MDFANKLTQHSFGNFEICDNTVFHRTNGLNIPMRSAKHCLRLASYGNKSAMEAVDRSEGQVFAHTVNKDGTEGYYGLLLANKENTALNSVDDIKKCDKSLAFGNGDDEEQRG